MNKARIEGGSRPGARQLDSMNAAARTLAARSRFIAFAIHMACGLGLGLAFANPILAQSAGAASTVAADVPAGPLADALNRFALQAGVEIVLDAEKVKGKTSPGLQGPVAVEEGFRRLLQGSGYQVGRTPEGYVLVPAAPVPATVAPPRPANPAGEATLPEVQVMANEPAESDRYREASSSVALFADKPLLDAPFSVGVYNEALIEDQRAFTLKEVLRNDPSISVQMPGGYYGFQNLGSRGFRVDNFNGYRLDGLPLVNTVAASIDDKSRVEVLKGPAALRFGFMPPGGAINLVRKRPTPEPSTSLQFDVDTFGSLYSQADVSNTVADGKFGYRLVVAGDSFDSFYDNAGGNRLVGSLFTEWKASEGVMVWTSIGAQDLERNGYYGPMISANGVVLDTGVKTNIMQDWARNRHKTFDAAIGTDITLDPNWTLRASLNYQETARESRLSYPYSVQDNGDYTEGALITNGPIKWDTMGGHLHLEGKFATGSLRHDVVVGTQYFAYDTSGQRSFPDVGPNNAYQLNPLPIPAVAWGPPPGKFEYEETGFFVTDTVAFSEKFSALVGVRHGRYENAYADDPASDDTVSAWSPTLGLMYAPVESVRTYVTYTRGLQDGGFDADTFEPLGVQESEQWEAGVKADLVGGITGEAAVFQIEQDLAIADPFGTDRFSGLQRHRGIELALRGPVTRRLQAGIATMFLEAEQVDTGDPAKDGKRPQYVPKYQVNAWGEFAVPGLAGLSLTSTARFVDGQYLDQTEQFAIDDYWVFDLGARYGFKAGGHEWTLRLNIYNVLDKRYYESGEFYPGDAGYLSYGAPRSANFSIAVRF